MKASPKFSIIVPVYNVAPYLRECLDSVLHQTFTDWECLCVNDGSKDESGAILDEYARKDKRFRVFHQKNKGVNFVRQYALEKCTGDWISSIDSDDWVEKDYLKHIYDSVKNNSCDMVWTDYYLHLKGNLIHKKQESFENYNDFQVAILEHKIWGGCCNKFYSNEFILKYKVSFPIKERIFICEDECFNLIFLSHMPCIKYLPVADYHYVAREGSLVRTKFSLEFVKSSIYVNSVMQQYAWNIDVKRLVEKRKKELKASIYCSPLILDDFFYSLYPKIKNLSGLEIRWWHKIFFWIAVRGFRVYILRLLMVIRKIKAKVLR